MADTDALRARIHAYSAGLQPPPPPADPVVLTSDLTAGLAEKLDFNGDASSVSLILPNGATRNIVEKTFERRSVTDYYFSTDLGDMAPAIERAAASGVKQLVFPFSGSAYTLKRPFSIPNANFRLLADGTKQTEIRLLGANNYFGIIGNVTTTSYQFYADGFVYTKEQAATQGAVFKIQNVYKWGLNNSYVYGQNKIWRVLELISASSGTSRNVDVDSILDRAVYGTAGTGATGTPGGRAIDNIFDYWYVTNALTNPSDPTRDGVFEFLDNFEAHWITNLKAAVFGGYAISFKGTMANRANNTLNLVINPNVESGGIAYMDAVVSSQIGGPVAWVSTASKPGIVLGANSTDNTIRGMQIGVSGTNGQAIADNGTSNMIEDIEAVGYDANADAALAIGSTAIKGRYRRIKASQLKRVIVDASPDTAGHSIEDIVYSSITGQPITGLVGSLTSNKIVRDITNLDASAPVGISSTGALSLPDKGSTFRINSGTVNTIAATYIGRRVTLLLENSGIVINDLQSGSGSGSLYLSPGGFTTDTARWRITLEWRGDYWWEINRSH